jgi:alpha-N-arabinofuranosidase
MILGDKRALRMVRDGALAGAQSVELAPGAADARGVGLTQERLTLRSGREYVGRVALAGAGARVEVSLVWGGGASARETIVIDGLTAGWTTRRLAFRARGGTDNGRLELVTRGAAAVRVGAVSLMPADNRSGWRADTLALLRELDAPVYRWPGGNFVSGYDWKDGVGDRDRRQPRKNPAWKGIESNDVGLHEFMELGTLIGAEPYVAVNTGLGDARSVAELVEYANGAPGTRMGRLRAQNGHPAPFGVRRWAVGNEMYGEWQLGHLPIDKYLDKHKQIVAAMRAVDPSIELVAVGAVGEWSRTMLARAAPEMTFISEHIYWQGKEDVVAHVAQVPAGIRAIADAHRAYRRELPALDHRDVKIALDEWNYWYGPFEYGELGTRYFLKDALGIAAGLHELFRQSDLFYMANYAQTVNVIGAIKTSADAAELEPTGLALALYRRRFGSLPVMVRSAPAPLDVAAAWTKDRARLTVAAVNPDGVARRVSFDLAGARLAAEGGRRFVLTGRSPTAGNAPGQPRGVDVLETAAPAPSAEQELAPLSVTLFAWPVVK